MMTKRTKKLIEEAYWKGYNEAFIYCIETVQAVLDKYKEPTIKETEDDEETICE